MSIDCDPHYEGERLEITCGGGGVSHSACAVSFEISVDGATVYREGGGGYLEAQRVFNKAKCLVEKAEKKGEKDFIENLSEHVEIYASWNWEFCDNFSRITI